MHIPPPQTATSPVTRSAPRIDQSWRARALSPGEGRGGAGRARADARAIASTSAPISSAGGGERCTSGYEPSRSSSPGRFPRREAARWRRPGLRAGSSPARFLQPALRPAPPPGGRAAPPAGACLAWLGLAVLALAEACAGRAKMNA
eukprot:scaffold1318_cov388-Prasinococcus_capsulatus_cf.AAC.84